MCTEGCIECISEEDCIEDSKEGCTKNSIECVLKVVASVLRGLRAGYTNIVERVLRVV